MEAYILYMTLLISNMKIYFIKKAQIAFLIAIKVIILVKYLDYSNIFLKKLARVLSKQTDINKHTNKLKDRKQTSFKLIYSLSQVVLKILKTYIKTNFANSFI